LRPDVDLAKPLVARSFSRQELGNHPKVQLVATDAWVAAVLGRRVFLLEPGPGLVRCEGLELTLEDGEALLDLRSEVGVPDEDRDERTWHMLTTRRILRLDLRSYDPETGPWKGERFPDDRGDLLWEAQGLFAFHRSGAGTLLSTDAGKTVLSETPDLLTSPAWTGGQDFVCQGRSDLYFGSLAGGEPLERLPAPEPLAAHPPIYDPATDRVYLSGETAVYWWQPGSLRLIPFAAAGGGAVLPAPEGVVILEGDRLRIMGHDEHVLWDSRIVMPDFAPAALPWDHAGEALLVPAAARGAGTQLLLADLKNPGWLLRTELDGILPCQPRLVPGGIVAAQRRQGKASLNLLWIGISQGDSAEE
jgi:hypothetical protein